MVHDPALIAVLEERTNGRKLGRSLKKVCDVWDIEGLELVRWKFNEYDYYSAEKAQMPTTARGLFTVGDRILVRGYDKFFNVGEVHTTKMPFLQQKLAGPYYATVKENGYLVLISGYQGKLVVTSKNSSGPCSTADDGRNYSQIARNWVLKHLSSVNQTEQALADLLERNDWTAAGELCDDSFEEHVLPYDETMAGIYLNGLNHNTGKFATEPPSVVQTVAKEFGFRITSFVEFSDFSSLQEFLERGQQTGQYGMRDVEGFVVRAKLASTNDDFFFKFKFDEPYLMYREWREVVKELVQVDAAAARRRAMRSKHRGSAVRFLNFAQEYLEARPDLATKLRNQNLGIIELRQAFFAANGADLDQISADAETSITQALLGLDVTVKKVMLVTVATLGCGKSTVAQILCYLLPNVFGHRQNDAMSAQRGRSKFVNLQMSIMNDFFDGKEVVTLDRNNSGRQEREQIFTEFDKLGAEMGMDIQYICLNYLPEGPSPESRSLTRERVYGRGDQHSTVKLSELKEKGINGIMCQFENRFQPVNSNLKPDNQFSAVIDLRAGESLANVRIILTKLREMLPKLEIPQFSDQEILAVFETVRNQVVHELPVATGNKKATENKKATDNKKGAKSKGKNENKNRQSETGAGASSLGSQGISKKHLKKLNYFGVQLGDLEYEQLLSIAKERIPAETLAAMKINPKFHVTLAHNQSHRDQFKTMMEKYTSRFELNGGRVSVPNERLTVKVTGIAWSPKVAAFTCNVHGCANPVAHVTIGIAEGATGRDANKLFNNDFIDEGIEVCLQTFEPLEYKDQEIYASP